LLLSHAFERLHAIRVQLKADSRNERSQKAVERIGAKREGVLRNHMILSDGHIRHSVYYSIIDSEWLAVKANLEAMMSRY
jgi:RimJ/RimL family protein N-acetyltransferase